MQQTILILLCRSRVDAMAEIIGFDQDQLGAAPAG